MRLTTRILGWLCIPAAALASGMACSLVRPSDGALSVARAGEWTLLPCQGCEASRLVIDVRRTTTVSGTSGRYVVARIRNLNPHAVVLTVDFSSGVAQEGSGEGSALSQHATFSLTAAGQPGGESLVVLRLPDVTKVDVTGVERFE